MDMRHAGKQFRGRPGTLAALDADDAFIALLIAAMDASAAFAVAADLVLQNGRMERLEGRCLRRLAADLGLSQATARAILDVMRMKNGA